MAMAESDAVRQDRLIVLIGGSGFLGRHLAQALLDRGARLRIACRHVERAWPIKALGNFGQVQFARADIQHPERFGAVLAGADAVVNLVGAFNGDLDAVQGRGAGTLAAAARDAGARAFVHVSAIGADAGSSVAYARTKAEGEAAVLAAFPQAGILRPSILFGPDDHFVTRFAGLAAMPALPVFAPDARLQPLFVDDAAEAIVAVLADALAGRGVHAGRIYEIAGPEIISMLAFNRRVAKAAGRAPLLVPLPDSVAALIAALPFTPISTAQLKLLKAGSCASGRFPGLAELGVAARPLGLFLDRWLRRFQEHGRFGARMGA